MKFKKSAVLILATGFSVITTFGFAGCEKEKDPEKNPNTDVAIPNKPIEDDPITDQPIVVPDNDEEKQLEAAVKRANNAFNTLAALKNFTYSAKVSDTNFHNCYIDGNVAKVDDCGVVAYYLEEDDQSYAIEMEDGAWHKNTTQQTSVSKMMAWFVDSMTSGFTWNFYDKASNRLQGTKEGDYVILQVEANSITMHVNYDPQTEKGQCDILLNNFGTTKVALPEKIVDDRTPVESENIYEIVDGKKVFNIVAIRDVLEPWLKGDNQFDNDMIAERLQSDTLTTREIICILPSVDRIEFRLILNHIDGFPRYGSAYFNDSVLLDGIANETVKTKEQFKSYLNSIKRTKLFVDNIQIKLDYTTKDYSAEQKAQFDAMTKNIFEKLDIDGLDPNKVLFAFKTPRGVTTASAGNGWLYATGWSHYYIVDFNGKLQILQVGVGASTSREGKTPEEHVIEDTNYWDISDPFITILQEGNKALYNYDEKELLK